ncbi:MAG: tRNA (adenosine(37)-N6)-dimethylallyltransferase MiaA [Ilumatobacter sp.]|nr:tRNA (adenosine(37)-N6)-dimethylallyltransferase MiaA [Ilumatobacter sp.]
MAVAQLAGDVDLISVDSMQVYRGMDIGTAKPSAAEQAAVRHHCIDLVDPSEEFSVAEFKSAHRAALADIADRGRRAVLVGGTGLYHRVVIDDFDLPGEWPDVRAELAAVDDTPSLFERLRAVDPAAAEKMEPGNRRRIIRALEVTIGSGRPFSSFGPGVDHYPPSPVVQIGVRRPRAVVAELIAARVRRMVASGLVDEVRTVAGSGFGRTAAQALGYKEILEHLAGRVSEDEAVETIITRTRQFAVRQERWFRRDPRVRWIDVDDDPVSDVTPIVLDALDHR